MVNQSTFYDSQVNGYGCPNFGFVEESVGNDEKIKQLNGARQELLKCDDVTTYRIAPQVPMGNILMFKTQEKEGTAIIIGFDGVANNDNTKFYFCIYGGMGTTKFSQAIEIDTISKFIKEGITNKVDLFQKLNLCFEYRSMDEINNITEKKIQNDQNVI